MNNDVLDSSAGETLQVFVDATGRRLRWLRRAGYAVAGLCGLYAAIVGFSLLGGPITPQTLLPLPGLPDDDIAIAVPSEGDGDETTGDPTWSSPLPSPEPAPRATAPVAGRGGTVGQPADSSAPRPSAPLGADAPGIDPPRQNSPPPQDDTPPQPSDEQDGEGEPMIENPGPEPSPSPSPTLGGVSPAMPPLDVPLDLAGDGGGD